VPPEKFSAVFAVGNTDKLEYRLERGVEIDSGSVCVWVTTYSKEKVRLWEQEFCFTEHIVNLPINHVMWSRDVVTLIMYKVVLTVCSECGIQSGRSGRYRNVTAGSRPSQRSLRHKRSSHPFSRWNCRYLLCIFPSCAVVVLCRQLHS
jgi:hypothetical protein